MIKSDTRHCKIKLLKGILTGENQIHDLLPKEVLVFRNSNETNLYSCEKKKHELTKVENVAYQKGHPEIIFI